MDVLKPTKLCFDPMLVWSLFLSMLLETVDASFFSGQETIYTTTIGFEKNLIISAYLTLEKPYN
jgi:hypothetical protein